MNEVKEIKILLTQGHTLLEAEYIKIVESATAKLQKIFLKANEYQRKIAVLKADWKKIKAEVDDLQKRREALSEKEAEVEKRLGEVIKREEQVDAMMKIQTNRQQILDDKEKELQTKARRTIYPEN